MLTFNGQGVNINNVKVTQQNIDSYFEGMKSVGECEDLEIVSYNKNIVNRKIADMKHQKGNYITSDNGGYNEPSSIEYLPKGKYMFSIDGYNVSNFSDSSIVIWKEDLSTRTYRKVATNKPFEILDGEVGFTWYGAVNTSKGETITQLVGKNIQVELGELRTSYVKHKQNKQTMTHEPLRGLPNGIRDKYVIIDGKWYIERNTAKLVIDSNCNPHIHVSTDLTTTFRFYVTLDMTNFNTVNYGVDTTLCDNVPFYKGNYYNRDVEHYYIEPNRIWVFVNRNKCNPTDKDLSNYLSTNTINIIVTLNTPTYEPIDYNPFEVYTP